MPKDSIWTRKGTIFFLICCIALITTDALAHGVTSGDKGYIQESSGMMPIPFIYLGAKHMIYNKPNIRKKDARQHVDVFVDVESFTIEDEVVFRDGAWLIESP